MDNTLWKGKVIKEESNDSRVPILQKLNNLIHKDKRIDCCLIPISDGVTIIRKL
jgi:predicted O-methyltransferase YrrM